jgi:hypothetical protein
MSMLYSTQEPTSRLFYMNLRGPIVATIALSTTRPFVSKAILNKTRFTILRTE